MSPLACKEWGASTHSVDILELGPTVSAAKLRSFDLEVYVPIWDELVMLQEHFQRERWSAPVICVGKAQLSGSEGFPSRLIA